MKEVPTTRLGRRGPRVSVIGVGLWQAGSILWNARSRETLLEIRRGLLRALEYGINFFDTAEIYGRGLSEKILGETIGKRDDVIVATKVAGYRWTRWDILKAVKRSRTRLGRDIDLIQHHWPPPIYAPVCNVIRALEEAVDKGLAHHIGLSNYPESLLEKSLECLKKYDILSNQVQYSLGYRTPENHLKPLMEKHGIILIAWSPLAKGALAGAKPSTLAQRLDPVFRRVAGDRELLNTLRAIAEKRGVTMAEIALAWLIAKRAIPIPGFRRATRIDSFVRAATLRLSDEDIEMLDRASAKYLRVYGERYNSLQLNRYIPGVLQRLVLALGV
ncbi:aldo/keto reductase [Pyrolobus fumarii 1A]|uniref:Aldo/keto reductase n=1 Tax=Pyrolobus fumarii (strain DSM 11204 / 1A) TaxID=694429 RepID=G0ECS4_PYRF1|nr:aldo/keto reductase [Pyrolobus fumarii]AEM39644.1 aldo/keto reductase [Pyrolobus fumarii 1A]